MVNCDCQLNGIYNHLRDTSLGMSVRDLTEEDSLGVRRSILWAVVSDTEVRTSIHPPPGCRYNVT